MKLGKRIEKMVGRDLVLIVKSTGIDKQSFLKFTDVDDAHLLSIVMDSKITKDNTDLRKIKINHGSIGPIYTSHWIIEVWTRKEGLIRYNEISNKRIEQAFRTNALSFIGLYVRYINTVSNIETVISDIIDIIKNNKGKNLRDVTYLVADYLYNSDNLVDDDKGFVLKRIVTHIFDDRGVDDRVISGDPQYSDFIHKMYKHFHFDNTIDKTHITSILLEDMKENQVIKNLE